MTAMLIRNQAHKVSALGLAHKVSGLQGPALGLAHTFVHSGLQVPALGQAHNVHVSGLQVSALGHKVCGGVKHV